MTCSVMNCSNRVLLCVCFFLLCAGLTQELKEIKKRNESLEEEMKSSQRSYNNEVQRLTQHYEQRVIVYSSSICFCLALYIQ